MEMNSKYRWLILVLGLCVAFVAFAVETKAQSHEGFIYGKVYTRNTSYTGAIRWGNEEVLWTDLFNAAKSSDAYKKLVPEKKDEDDSWLNYDWSFGSIWDDKVIEHQFTTQFGNIAELEVLTKSRARLTLKNGSKITVNGEGYNDIGAEIQITDSELGIVRIDWDNVSRIEFMSTPAKLETVFGSPLYGTVEGMRREKFTGFIVWDNDERLSTDKLDGDSEDGDVSLRFSDIESIQKRSNGCEVKLMSGRELYLHGSNDVNNGNRGILVIVPDVGIVKFTWEAFRTLTFSDPNGKIQSYEKFPKPKFLQGSVSRFDGEDITGRIVYDIDESMDFEFIEGKDDEVEYQIVLRNIKRITPKNSDFSTVELTSGEKLLLGELRDISSRNGGLLVFPKGKKEPEYISWRKVNAVIFN
jgi:hypothetical protein